MQQGDWGSLHSKFFLDFYPICQIVIPDFKDKTRYAPYVSFRDQISHIATNKG